MKELIQLGLRARGLVMIVTVVTLVVSLTACGNLFGFGGGGDNPGHLGASFTLPAEAIIDPPDGIESMSVYVYTDHVGPDGMERSTSALNSGAVTDDTRVPALEITEPPNLGLLVSIVSEEVTVTPDSVKTALVNVRLKTQESEHGSELMRTLSDAEGNHRVGWWYVDSDVTINGESVEEEEGEATTRYVWRNVGLKRGWNNLIISEVLDESGDIVVTTVAGRELSGMSWTVEER